MKLTVSCAVAAILSGVSFAAPAVQPALSQGAADKVPVPGALTRPKHRHADPPATSGLLSEVIVTATRRAENVEDVPITMQVLNARSMQQLHIRTFEDFLTLTPNLTSADSGPGQNDIFIRGISDGAASTQESGSVNLWPNTALYLDNQSVQLPGRNLDVYTADLNRIEVLEGPQGTLFGSGAEAGAIRYITNKPQLDVTDGNFTATYGVTAHGGPNTAVSGVLNLPVIRNHLALRFVVFSDSRGGYINNVFGTFTRHDTDLGIAYANYPAVNGKCPDGGVNNGYCVPPGSPVANNLAMVRNHINPLTYKGVRGEALYQFDTDWSLLVTEMYQNMDAEGVFYQYPRSSDNLPLKPLEVTLFTPNYNKDKFSNTAWTLHGKIADLEAIYTGGVMTRNSSSEIDYTNYARGVYGDYYQCYGPGTGYDNSLTSTCFSPVSSVNDNEQDTHWQHELRLQTPANWRIRGIVGLYHENYTVADQSAWHYRTIPTCTANGPAGTPGNTGCYSTIGTAPGSTPTVPGPHPDTSYYIDAIRKLQQTAEFISVSADLIPHSLTISAGARHFLFLNSEVGDTTPSGGCFEAGTSPTGCYANANNLNAANLRDSESGWRTRADLSWRIHPVIGGNRQRIMTYFTFSQGYRPGGFNQNGGSTFVTGPDGQPQYIMPKTYRSDSLNNYEIGWKTQWRLLHRSFQWNAAFYREDWNNVQITFFQPLYFGPLNFQTNGQNFRIDGAETSLIAQLWRGLTLRASGAWNSSEQVNSPALIDNNPQSVNFGRPLTEDCKSGPTNCIPVVNLFGPRGSPTADSPPLSYSLLLRYDFEAPNGYLAHVQVGMFHTGHSFTQSGANPPFVPGVTISTEQLRFEDPAYTTYSASIGVSKDKWYVTVYGQNLGNSNAAVYTSTEQFIVAQTPLRPRVIGATIGYNF